MHVRLATINANWLHHVKLLLLWAWRLGGSQYHLTTSVTSTEVWICSGWSCSGWSCSTKTTTRSHEARCEKRYRWKRFQNRFLLYSHWSSCSTGCFRAGSVTLLTLIKLLNNNSIVALRMAPSCFSKMKMRWEMLWKVQNLLSFCYDTWIQPVSKCFSFTRWQI